MHHTASFRLVFVHALYCVQDSYQEIEWFWHYTRKNRNVSARSQPTSPHLKPHLSGGWGFKK